MELQAIALGYLRLLVRLKLTVDFVSEGLD
jgi:hypothetical protein